MPGIGVTSERSLWDQGCRTWADFAANPNVFRTGTASDELALRTVENSIAALQSREHQYFQRRFSVTDSWRAFSAFRDSCAYVDIETDGGNSGNAITTIGLWDGKEFQVFVRGQNLANFPDAISHYNMVVTFFGASFDLPMIRKAFRNIELDQIHLDLCPTLRKLGIRGGLKKIEKQLGISRGDDTDGLSGMDAIRLWNRYRNFRDEEALATLIAYNREDVVNLETLAVFAYNELLKGTGAVELGLAQPL